MNEPIDIIETNDNLTADQADEIRQAWLKATGRRCVGAPHAERRRAATWRKAARVVAAYRDRYRLTDDTPFGTAPESAAQRIDAARARSALTQATEVAGTRTGRSMPQPVEHRSPGRSL